MPWKYSVEETALLYGTERVEIDSADNIYKVTPANGQTAAAGAAPDLQTA